MIRKISKQLLVANLALVFLLALSFLAITFTDITASPATHTVMLLSAIVLLGTSVIILGFLYSGWEP